ALCSLRRRGAPDPRPDPERSQSRAGAARQDRGRRPRALRGVPLAATGLLRARSRLLRPLPHRHAHRGGDPRLARSLCARAGGLEGLPRAGRRGPAGYPPREDAPAVPPRGSRRMSPTARPIPPGYTERELMVIAAGREIRDGETVFVRMRLPLLAFAFAKRTHAPGAVGLCGHGIVRESPAAETLMTMSDTPNVRGAVWST